jgi:hypothetical protein
MKHYISRMIHTYIDDYMGIYKDDYETYMGWYCRGTKNYNTARIWHQSVGFPMKSSIHRDNNDKPAIIATDGNLLWPNTS